ncbi:hypothetical protein [Streptomyces sp. NPDC057386]|uniref:hypothetical protein n=1 Tax=unclassified Streptomyces TaxID=2593676 RepID=UPI0036306834
MTTHPTGDTTALHENPAAVAALLDAGAVLPPGTTDRQDADTLTVRTYTHPALDDRPVVRLVPRTLGEAEDLALDFLGLVRAPDVHEAGQVRRETLGFPAWALVNDPANGHHALALVKDVERLARQAKSRPGTAKEGFEELGGRLGRAVPHFLPTFYEQAARVFLQHDNTTYAAVFFGKAREAERVHALTVDEERHRAVFLEFAFAGALTVKALKQHVRDLSARLSPAEAWAQYRQLVVERCAAGMPPYAALPQDARALIKAAGLDRQTEECALVAELLASPAAVRAPASFWNHYRPALVALTHEQPAVRARLLEIMPAGLGRSTDDDEFWLTLLSDTGADRLLTGETPDSGIDPADWLSRWALHRKHGASTSRRSPATLALVTRMTAHLRERGRPVDLFTGRRHAGADLDLLDLCLAEGVPLTLPDSGERVDLAVPQWLTDTRPGRRDLTAVASDARCRPMLHRAVGGLHSHRPDRALTERIADHPVLSDVLRAWLEDAADDLVRAAGLPAARSALDRLRPFAAVAARVGPRAVAQAAELRLEALLGRTLRAGVLDELGWPALDEAVRRLEAETSGGKGPRHLASVAAQEAWPALVLSRGHKALVVGPDGILLEHDLRLPPDLDHWQRPSFRYTDGELLVTWWHNGKQRGYWTSRPSEVFTVGGEHPPRWYGQGDAGDTSLPLPGGGRATGGRALHAGDTDLPPSRPVLGDGTTYWRQGRQGRHHVWLEYDPATGTHGRASLPAFLTTGIRDGSTLLQQRCSVLPLQPGLENSPFGTDGTVLGRWVRTDHDSAAPTTTVGTPDGRTVTVPARAGTHGVPLGALRLPGGAAPVVLTRHRQLVLCARDDTGGITELGAVTALLSGGEFAAGTPLVPPADFWHALRPRDEAASEALRKVTDDQADALLWAALEALRERDEQLEAARRSTDGRPGSLARAEATVPSAEDALRPAVSAALPALTDPQLLTGVTAIVRAVLRLGESVGAFLNPPAPRTSGERTRTEGMFADYRPENGDDQTLREATAGIAGLRGWSRDGNWDTLRQIRAVNHVLSGRPADGTPLHADLRTTGRADGWRCDETTVPGIGPLWPRLLEVLRPLAYRAASPALPDHHRQALLLLLEAVADGPLTAPGGALREIVLGEPHEDHKRVGQVLRRDGRTVVVLGCQSIDSRRGRVEWLALDHDPSGEFGAIAHFALERETPLPAVFPAEKLAEVTALVRAKGPAPWQPDAPAALTAATGDALGPVQAALLLAGKPDGLTDEAAATTGLKRRQAELGDELLHCLPDGTALALLGALLPDTPADLWTSGPDTAAAGRVWAERTAGTIHLPENIAAELRTAGRYLPHATAVLNPHRTPWTSRTTVQRLDKDGRLTPDDPRAVPSRYDLEGSVIALARLAYLLPYGHPLRAALPGSLTALRSRLADPGLLLDLNVSWTQSGGRTATALNEAYGLPAPDADGLVRPTEALVLRIQGDRDDVRVRPAGLTGADDPVLDLLEGLVGSRHGSLHALRTLLSDDFAATLAAGTDPAEATGHPQNPQTSAPALVAEVARTHGLSEDAAALYLQLLALPDPTDRDRARWTGWKPARLKKARTELAATDLVVEAKRARAGRTLFLPGGWLDLKAPALPLETWKQALYPVDGGGPTTPLRPLPDLFAHAWQRVRDGDAPAYEELTTRATRKGRRR